MVDAFSRHLADEPHVRVLCQCSPYHISSALYPVIRQLGRAEDRAVSRSAFAEALAHFGAGRAEVGKLAEGPDRLRNELALLLKLGPALSIIEGPQSPEVPDVRRPRSGASPGAAFDRDCGQI
ncbi:MAG: hypothetical protein ABI190_12325 [Casimicrobiaceae bacterium]